jgi:hypothetical protein
LITGKRWLKYYATWIGLKIRQFEIQVHCWEA